MLTDGTDAYVLEINTDANISLHMFPTEGKPRNIASHLIDYYFPNSIKYRGNNQHMSFDYLSIIDHLSNNYSAYIEIRTLKQDEMFSNKIIVDGENFNDKFIGFIVKQAKSRRLDGSITLLIENKLSLICTTYYKNYIDWLCKQIKNYKKGNAKIEFIQIEEFNNQLTSDLL